MTTVYMIMAAIFFLAALTGLLFKVWHLEETVDQLNARLLSTEQRQRSAPPMPAKNTNSLQFL